MLDLLSYSPPNATQPTRSSTRLPAPRRRYKTKLSCLLLGNESCFDFSSNLTRDLFTELSQTGLCTCFAPVISSSRLNLPRRTYLVPTAISTAYPDRTVKSRPAPPPYASRLILTYGTSLESPTVPTVPRGNSRLSQLSQLTSLLHPNATINLGTSSRIPQGQSLISYLLCPSSLALPCLVSTSICLSLRLPVS